jgi:alpha-D-xyloside xylohydrolase
VYHFYDTFNRHGEAAGLPAGVRPFARAVRLGRDLADNVEPQGYPEGVNVHAADTRWQRRAAPERVSAEHNRALYEGWRSVGPDQKRVVRAHAQRLLRSAALRHRLLVGRHQLRLPHLDPADSRRPQLRPGGEPYWTTDIGGYFGGGTDWSSAANNELFTRWFQFGAFCPMFRFHGPGCARALQQVWSAATKANLLAVDNLRYRLMPYIYSLAWKVTDEGYTIMRHRVRLSERRNVFNIRTNSCLVPALRQSGDTRPARRAGKSIFLPGPGTTSGRARRERWELADRRRAIEHDTGIRQG